MFGKKVLWIIMYAKLSPNAEVIMKVTRWGDY